MFVKLQEMCLFEIVLSCVNNSKPTIPATYDKQKGTKERLIMKGYNKHDLVTRLAIKTKFPIITLGFKHDKEFIEEKKKTKVNTMHTRK